MYFPISKLLANPNVLRACALFVCAVFASILPDIAYAADGTGDAMPYVSHLTKFRKTLEGPVPFAISLVGIVGCGAMLIFGGEISGFLRTMVFLVLVIAVIVQAGSMVKFLGGSEDAVTYEAFGVPGTASRYLT
jgi:type IV secretory pathway VirB2 component (pilin)